MHEVEAFKTDVLQSITVVLYLVVEPDKITTGYNLKMHNTATVNNLLEYDTGKTTFF